jgi:hypothetical protein
LAFGNIQGFYVYGNTLSNISASNILQPFSNLVVSNSITATNIFTSIETISGSTGQTSLYVTGNIYASNSLVTSNIIASGFTSNTTNTTLFYDTLTIPYVNTLNMNSYKITTTTANVSGTSNLATLFAVTSNIGTLNVQTLESITGGLNVSGTSNLATLLAVTSNIGTLNVFNPVSFTNIYGDGSGISGLNASNLNSGIVSSSLIYGNTLSNINASNLNSGIVSSSLIYGNTLSNINASNLNSGIVNSSLIYGNTLSNINASNLNSGIVNSSLIYGNTLSNINASNLNSGIVNSSLIYGNTLSNINASNLNSGIVNSSLIYGNTLSNINASNLNSGIVSSSLIYGNTLSNIISLGTLAGLYATGNITTTAFFSGGGNALTNVNITGGFNASATSNLSTLFSVTSNIGTLNVQTLESITGGLNVSGVSNLSTLALNGTTGQTTVYAVGNIYSTNAVTTTNVFAAGFSSNATNTNFLFDTLTIPFIYSSTANVAVLANLVSLFSATSNIGTLNVASLESITGNINVLGTSNLVTLFSTVANIGTLNVSSLESITGNINVQGTSNLSTLFSATSNIGTLNVQTLESITGGLNVLGTSNLSTVLAVTSNIGTLNVQTLESITGGLNVSGVSNLSTVVLTGTTGQTTVNATGNIYASNALTTKNVYASNILVVGAGTIGSNIALFSNIGGGSNVVVINSNAWVGIGTTNPTSSLTVAGNASFATDTFTVPFATVGTIGILSGATIGPSSTVLGSNLMVMANVSGGSNAVVINSSAWVGIGTTNPAVALDAYTGTINAATVTATTHYGALAGSNTIAGSSLSLNTGSTAPVVIQYPGLASGGTGMYMIIGGSSSGKSAAAFGFVNYGTNTSNVAYIGVNTATFNQSVFVNGIGNLGIGTTNPAVALDAYTGTMNAATVTATTLYGTLAGSNAITGSLLTASTTPSASANVLTVRNTGATGNIAQFSFSSGVAMIINNSGYVLIGYTASNGSYPLQVNGQIFATNATIATSDAKFKSNVDDLTDATAIISALRPVTFEWKEHSTHNFPSGPQVGFIAQDVQEVLKNTPYLDAFVKKNSLDGEDFLGIAEGHLIPVLVAALKDTNERLETAQNDIDLLETRLAALESLVRSSIPSPTIDPSVSRTDALLAQAQQTN